MGVEEPNLADPSVYSSESFSHWVINFEKSSEHAGTRTCKTQTIKVHQEEGLCAICVCSGRSQRSRVWCECDHSRGQQRYFLSSCQRPGTQRLPFTHSQLWSPVSGFAKSAFYPHRARPHLRRVNSSGRPRGHTHTHQILSV